MAQAIELDAGRFGVSSPAGRGSHDMPFVSSRSDGRDPAGAHHPNGSTLFSLPRCSSIGLSGPCPKITVSPSIRR